MLTDLSGVTAVSVKDVSGRRLPAHLDTRSHCVVRIAASFTDTAWDQNPARP
jgi:hypothetical protein